MNWIYNFWSNLIIILLGVASFFYWLSVIHPLITKKKNSEQKRNGLDKPLLSNFSKIGIGIILIVLLMRLTYVFTHEDIGLENRPYRGSR